MNNNINKFKEFCSLNEDLLGIKSKIWVKLSSDFGNDINNVRGYGINCLFSTPRALLYIKINSYLLRFFNKIKTISIFFEISFKYIFSRALSLVIFQSFHAAKKYSFKDYDINVYRKSKQHTSNLDDFHDRINSDLYNINFSHHTFKSFCYLNMFEKTLSDFSFENKSILEIGGGMLNFSALCFEKVDSLLYVVVDLPEVIHSSYSNIISILTDVDVFLPHQIDEALTCNSKKRLLLCLPGQLSKLNLQFDLFVNHESFAEMDINTVEHYLGLVSSRLRLGGYVFLVNRFFRIQDESSIGLKNLDSVNKFTNFTRYKPSWCDQILFTVEPFRQNIITQSDRPNAFYIGRKF